LGLDDGLAVQTHAPADSQLREIAELLRKGKRVTDLAHVGHREKVKRCIFVLAEAIRKVERTHFQTVKSVALARDEGHGRLLVRFTATNSKLEVRQGILGLTKNFGSGAVQIHRATRRVLDTFCTYAAGAPRRSKVTASPLDTCLLDKIRNCIRQLSFDAAADEVLSGRMAAAGERLDGVDIFAPNLKSLNRDKTHACRRTGSCCVHRAPFNHLDVCGSRMSLAK